MESIQIIKQKVGHFEFCILCFVLVFEMCRKYLMFKMYFGIVGMFRIINCYFEYGIRIRCLFLYMGT